jgi:hypothetical protein
MKFCNRSKTCGVIVGLVRRSRSGCYGADCRDGRDKPGHDHSGAATSFALVMKFSPVGEGTNPTLKWDGLWLTPPKPTGLINLKPPNENSAAPQRAQDGWKRCSRRGAETPPYLRRGGPRPVACRGFLIRRNISASGRRLLQARQRQVAPGRHPQRVGRRVGLRDTLASAASRDRGVNVEEASRKASP